MEDYVKMAEDIVTQLGIKIIAAIAILIIGKWIANLMKKVTEKLLTKSKIESTLTTFLSNLVYFVLLTFVVIAALGQLGIQTTSIIAVLGAAGLAVGLALQGSLSNFASGTLLIIFRPFKVGDFVEFAGETGTVEKIQIFTTQLKTLDNKTVIVPNSMITGDKIINYTDKDYRRVDMVFGIGYGDDILKAKSVIHKVLNEEEKIMKDPEPFVGVLEHADSSINLAVRPWVKPEDYWDVYFNITENVKLAFDREEITIPFPQRDIHLFEHKAE